MVCPVLESLATAVAAVEALPVLSGLGAEAVLEDQVHVLAGAVTGLQRELAVRMAALERAAPGATDVRGAAARAGLDPRRAQLLRRVGVFADAHREVERAWRSGSIRMEQVELLRAGTTMVNPDQRRILVAEVLPLLPGLAEKDTRALIEFAVDQLNPGDPDHDELAEHAARRLAWSRIAGGGLAFEGYLPTAEAAAFTTAIDALVESLRVAGDCVTPAQRRADGLAALVATATEHGLPSGGGLPAAMTLTVSLTEASRIARRDPAQHGRRISLRPRGRSTVGEEPAGDATVRFGMCCAAVTPILVDQKDDSAAASTGSWPGRPHEPDPPSKPDAQGPLGSLLDRIARSPVQPLAVGRSVRLATAAQRQALRVRDGGCVIPDCDIDAAYTQPHHVVGWAIGGRTDLDAMVSLCWVHHRLTELGRFTFQPRGDGEPLPPGSLEHPLWWITPPVQARR